MKTRPKVVAFLFTVAALTTLHAPAFSEEAPRGPLAANAEIKADIHALNLINGLDLTCDQCRALLESARELQAKRCELEDRLLCAETQGTPVFEEVRAVLMTGEFPDEELERAVWSHTGPPREMLLAFDKERVALATEAAKVLTPNQLALVDEYKPCIIVPKTRDTSRIGAPAGGNAARMADHLARIRSIPDRMYATRRGEIVARMAGGIEKHHHNRIKVTDRDKAALASVLDKARSLSDVDFQAQKLELARQAMLYDDAEQEIYRNQRNRADRVCRFLLSEGAVKAYEARLARAGAAP